jgi:selenocysteine-specific elongation factor
MQAERARIVKTVREFHQQFPLLPGIARQELRGGAPVFVMDALLTETKEIVAEGELVRSRGHKLVLKEDEEQARAKIERAFEETGLAVPAMAEVLAKSGVEAARARSLLQILLREKRLVRISEDLVFHQSALSQLRELLARHKGERFRVPEFKEWTGISRKYAIPLLEFLDRERITRREGDERIVL